MTPEMTGRQENTNQKQRMELTLDLICNLALDGRQRDRIREILREQFSNVIEEEREACAKIAKQVAEEQRPELAEAYKMRASIRGALHEGRIEAVERIESQIRARSS